MAFFKNFFEKVIEIAKFYRSYSMKASYFKHLENHITARHIPGWRARLWRRRTNRGWRPRDAMTQPATMVLPPWTLHSIGRPGISMRGERILYGLAATGKRAQLRSQSLLDGSKQVDPPSFHRQHNVELLGKEANRMGIGDLRENIYVHASPKCERRISMEHVSSHPAICTNVFKNGDATTSKAAFTRKWIEMINRIEKNKQLQYGKIQ